MATQTPYISLVLMNVGDNVGTWGLQLNQNFQAIDTVAGEVISARGSHSSLSERLSVSDSEISLARGTFSNLNDRLSYLINPNGTSRIENFDRATGTTFGVVKLSKPSADPLNPVVVETTDTRLLTSQEKSDLTSGAVTHVHKHHLIDIADVTVTSKELNQALKGISPTVTAMALNTLTGGNVVGKDILTIPNAGYNYTGIVSLTATPDNAQAPLAVGTNDTRMLTQLQKDQLVSSGVTSLHKHKLADGASDLVVTAVELNRLAGASTRVSATNLDILTSGNSTTLHTHDTRYYTKAESDSAITTAESRVNANVTAHSTSTDAHKNSNLTLGDTIVKSLSIATAGGVVDVRTAAGEANTAQKIRVKDSSGLTTIFMSGDGTINAKKIITEEHQVTKTTTLSQDAVLTSNLTVKGNTVLGDSETTDTVIVNAQSTQLNSPLSVKGAITTTGTVNGVNITTLGSDSAANKTEITVARSTYPTLNDRIMYEVSTLNASISAVKNDKANPNQVTITQAIAADNGTDITVLELETLTDGSNADALHAHSKYDNIINAGKVSPIYGTFGDMNLRTDNIEQRLNATETEVANARNGKISVDARLDEVDLKLVDKQVQLTTHTGEIADINTRIGAEVATLNTKIDANAATIAARATALEQKDVALTTEIIALKAEDVSIKTLVQGNSKTLNASSIVARKEVYKDINISVVGAVVGENIQATGYIDQFVSVSVYNKTDNALIPSADFEYLKVEMVGAVSTLKFKLKTTSSYAVNSNKVNVVIIG